MKDGIIIVHNLINKPIAVRPEHVGMRWPVTPETIAAGDNPKGKTVLMIDGQRQEVLETMDEIAKLIKDA